MCFEHTSVQHKTERNKLNERNEKEENKNPVHFSRINLDQRTKNIKKEN